jgi:outer membrane protein assembly factor BamB
VSTGIEWARLTAMEPAGPGQVAAAWTDRPLGGPGIHGRVLLMDTHEGGIRWEQETTAYPRAIRLDAGRGRLVIQEHADPSGNTFAYAISARGLLSGAEESRWEREGAISLALRVGNVTGSPDAEVVTSDVEVIATPDPVPASAPLAARVIAADGATGDTIWIRPDRDTDLVANRPSTVPQVLIGFGLQIVPTDVGPRVVLGTWSQIDARRELVGLDGDTGIALWRHYGEDLGFPILMGRLEVADQPAVFLSTFRQVGRAFSAVDGSVLMEHRLLGEIVSFAFHDVNEDGVADLIVGSESGAVLALDGLALDDDPGLLWRAETADGVHKLEIADLDADGAPELVAAAGEDGVHVFDPASGARRYRVEAPPFAWTFTLTDLDDDGSTDVVVPGHALRGFRGADGQTLWSYPPVDVRTPWTGGTFFSEAGVTSGGLVVAQFVFNPPDAFFPLARHVVAVDGRTGVEEWRVEETDTNVRARLWRSVATGELPGAPDGVAVTYSPAGNDVKTDVHDASTGELLYEAPDAAGAVHMLTETMPGVGLVEVNWRSVATIEPSGASSTSFPSSFDATMADFGDLGPAFLRALFETAAYPPDAATGARGSFPQPAAEWRAFIGGMVAAVDIDGDRVDEIVSTTFDAYGANMVFRMENTGLQHIDSVFHGLAILEAVPVE